MKFESVIVVSLPRSGSTVLTRLLEEREDIFAMPESFFPAVLEMADVQTFANKLLVAALFVQSCSDGSPLDLDEALACVCGDRKATMDALAIATAKKFGRNTDGIAVVVWKQTRLVGSLGWAAQQGIRFVILRRPLLNVYESQFRVHFGAKNHNPRRFALFAESYYQAFSRYPADSVFSLDYADIPTRMDELVEWIGSNGVRRASGTPSVAAVAGKNSWHADICKDFIDRDAEKLKHLTREQISRVKGTTSWLRQMPWLGRVARLAADKRQYKTLLKRAMQQLAGNDTVNPHNT